MTDQIAHEADLGQEVDRLVQTWRAAAGRPGGSDLEGLAGLLGDISERGYRKGYRRISELAGIAQIMLQPVAAGEEEPTGELLESLDQYVQALHELAGRLPEAPPPESGPAEDHIPTLRRLVVLEPAGGLAETVGPQLWHFGYRLEAVDALPVLLDRLGREPTDAVVVDLDFTGAVERETVTAVQAAVGRQIPVLAVGSRSGMEERLAAARAGTATYLLKPVDVHGLVDELDRATAEPGTARFHVLVVEDSPTQAAYIEAILQRAGMQVTHIADPMQVLEALAEHATDLILMDMYMPGCDGMELARVIRQFQDYAAIPIVYLSAETAVDRQLDAMSLGADDFLTQPIDPAHLIRSVAIRAERARSLRSLMVTDHLTGLLNHTRIKEQLEKEVARAKRKGTAVAFAMLDLDRFKEVNDSYGHAVGDHVLRILARVLRQRLRRSDYIGRYGGEEFAVILPEATAGQAAAVLGTIRDSFSRIRHASADGPFQVTFSAGVAEHPAVADANDVMLSADRALYRAKRDGRNRVVEWTPAITVRET